MGKQHVVLDEKGNVLEFSINKRKWGTKYLYNSKSSRKCCMGFLGCAMNIPLYELSFKPYLSITSSLRDKLPLKMKKLLVDGDEPSMFANTLASINDNTYFTQKEKELKITEEFANKGIKVTFTG